MMKIETHEEAILVAEECAKRGKHDLAYGLIAKVRRETAWQRDQLRTLVEWIIGAEDDAAIVQVATERLAEVMSLKPGPVRS
jgi:hypothetical protein